MYLTNFGVTFEQRHLYSYATSKRASGDVLNSLLRWILDAQRSDGGIAAYYSLLTGYSESYPEVTGYIIPTLYDFASTTGDDRAVVAADRATRWLLSLQMRSSSVSRWIARWAAEGEAQPSVFNTGQILQGLVRAHVETNRAEILQAAVAAGDWLVKHAAARRIMVGPGRVSECGSHLLQHGCLGAWRSYPSAPASVVSNPAYVLVWRQRKI